MPTDTVETRTCLTCPHFNVLNRECRAEPPKAVPIPTGPGSMQTFGIWPPTREEHWCGAHPARKVSVVFQP